MAHNVITNNMYWTTREGNILHIKYMETSHIKDCIEQFKRQMPDFEEDETTAGAKSFRETIKKFEDELLTRI